MLYLKSMGRADKTTRMYRQAVEWFAAEYLATSGQPPHAPDTPERYTFDPVTDWADVTRAHIRGWLACLFARGYTDSYVNNQYRCLQQFFRWFAEDEEVPNIMLGMTPPRVAEKPVPVFSDDEIRALFATVQGRDIWSRRDLAILLFLRDTGVRLSELSGLQLDDVDVVEQEATVTGKAKRTRTVKYSFARHPRPGQVPADARQTCPRARVRGVDRPEGAARRLRDLPARAAPRRPGWPPGSPPAPVPPSFLPHVAGPGRRRGRPHGTERLELPTDAAPLRQVRCRGQGTPRL